MKRIGALLAAVGLLIGACGGSAGPDPEANPKEALVSAFENLADSDGMEIVLSLDATAESLNGLAGDGGEAMDEETAQKILDSSLRVLTKGQGEDASFEMVATIAGEEDLEIKVVDKVVYFRADAEGLTETFGGDPSELETMGQQAKAQGLTFVEPALNGEWVAITGAEQLAQQFGGATDAGQMTENQEKLVRDITQALEESATVTNEGSDDAGEHLAVSLPVREIYQRMMSSFQGIPGFPGGQLPPESEIPDESVVMDVWIDDDRVTQAAIDFAQFASMAEEGGGTGGRVALLMEFDEFDEDIETPDDAVEVPAEQLMQLFMGAAGMGGTMGGAGQGSGGTPPDFDCAQLEGAPPAIKEQFADMCPDL
jgi:hypothetical protein